MALEEAILAQDGHAVIGFKAPGSARAAVAGLRAAVPTAAIQGALQLLAARDVDVLEYYEFMGAAHVRFPPGMAATLRDHPLVDYIEPRQWWSIQGVRAPIRAFGRAATMVQMIPWGIELVRAPEAWSRATGVGASVQIIDTGHDRGHEDLPLVPLGNCAGALGGCDDGPDSWHGTHVLGTLTGRDNALGVIGVAPGVAASDVHVYGACESEEPFVGDCPTTAIISGIQASIWFDVLSMSVGATFDFGASNAVAQAWAEGVVLVAAAGNRASGQPSPANFYPASYTNVIGVSGAKPDKSFASSSPCPAGGGQTWASNSGSYVDIAGPFWALSTVGNDGYEDEGDGWCGTSMATPHVAGTAALLREKNPSWSNAQIRDRLFSTAYPACGGVQCGHGIVDAAKALGITDPPIPQDSLSAAIDGPTEAQPGQACTWRAIVNGGVSPYTYLWWGVVSGNTETIRVIPVGSGPINLYVESADGQTADATISFDITAANCN